MNLYGKRVLKAAIFFLGLLLLLVLASHLFMPKDNTREAGIEEFFANGILAEKKNTIDILISGDSFSYSSLVPSELWKTHGYTSYENGTNDQHLDYTMILLRRAFENQSPKLVILEPSLILHEVSSLNALIEHLEPFLPVFHDHDRWKSLTWKDFYKKPEYTQVMNYKGYQYFTKIKPASDSEAHNMVPTDDVAPIPASGLSWYSCPRQTHCRGITHSTMPSQHSPRSLTLIIWMPISTTTRSGSTGRMIPVIMEII